MSLLEKMRRRAALRAQSLGLEATKDKPKMSETSEMKRILSLPVIEPMSEEQLERFSRDRVLAPAYEEGFRLLPTQAMGLKAYEDYAGLMGPIGVGLGKTILTLMIANHAYQKGIERIVLFIPPELLDQLTRKDIKDARKVVPITYPVHVLGGRPRGVREQIARSGKRGLYIIPYSLLSTKDTEENLWSIKPELIIGDEAHRISNRDAARTRRVQRYIEEHNPECVFVSGTITSKTLEDYYHLMRSALKGNCPVPLMPSLAREWAALIDAGASDWAGSGDGFQSQAKGPLVPLVDWAKKRFPRTGFEESRKGFRKAYKYRLNSCPGVVSSGDAEVRSSIIFKNKPVEEPEKFKGWERLDELVKKVEQSWLTPNDDEIDHAIHTWKWLYELSAGFYNELVWPTKESLAERRNIGVSEAAALIERAKEHHSAHQDYTKALREWLLSTSVPGLDTPLLVAGDMSRHGDKNVPASLYRLWKEVHDKDFEGRPERDSRSIRVCPFKVNTAADWAESTKGGGILWVHHQEMGRWMVDVLRERGIDSVYCPAGDAGNKNIVDPDNANKKIVASITAHGTGKNLQHFQEQIFVQWPRSAKTAEQVLGRLHRTGQKADEVPVNTINTIEFDHLNFAACLNDALYIHQTVGNRQKMVYGNYSPLPKIFPPAVLREKGMEPTVLDREAKSLMQKKFGA